MKYEVKEYKYTCDKCGKSITMKLAENEIPPGWMYDDDQLYILCATCTLRKVAEDKRQR
jgi:phage terminase large subunit GpA-like protein